MSIPIDEVEFRAEPKQEAHPEAAAILRDAGWKPHDLWGVYTRATLVMGFSPDGQNFDVKNWGLDIHGPDAPDDPVEAAQWLVALRAPVVLTTEATLDPLAPSPEEVEDPGHEGDGETGAAPQAGALDEGADQGDLGVIASDLASDAGGEDAPFDVLDADFTEDPLLEFGGEVLEEHPEEAPPPQDRFYGLDDLDRRRNLRVGDVVVFCADRIDARIPDREALRAALAEERNYVMGVETLGWPRSDVRQRELDRLEAISAWIMDTEEHRDTLTGILVKADHAFLEGFVIEDGWP